MEHAYVQVDTKFAQDIYIVYKGYLDFPFIVMSPCLTLFSRLLKLSITKVNGYAGALILELSNRNSPIVVTQTKIDLQITVPITCSSPAWVINNY